MVGAILYKSRTCVLLFVFHASTILPGYPFPSNTTICSIIFSKFQNFPRWGVGFCARVGKGTPGGGWVWARPLLARPLLAWPRRLVSSVLGALSCLDCAGPLFPPGKPSPLHLFPYYLCGLVALFAGILQIWPVFDVLSSRLSCDLDRAFTIAPG